MIALISAPLRGASVKTKMGMWEDERTIAYQVIRFEIMKRWN
jgi:hypothetical protein